MSPSPGVCHNFAPPVPRRQYRRAAGISYRRAFASDAPPSDTVRVGVIGTGRQGVANINGLGKQKRAKVVAVCDVDTKHLAPATFANYRKLLEAKDIDAVLVATPDHWHALTEIHACQAGKDV